MSTRDFHAEWLASIKVSHDAEVARGIHDTDCEHRDNGHFLCNCRGRTRVASGFIVPPGELEHQYPLCPRCSYEVTFDGDSFCCYSCRVMWGTDNGSTGRFMDDNEPLEMAKWDAAHSVVAS